MSRELTPGQESVRPLGLVAAPMPRHPTRPQGEKGTVLLQHDGRPNGTSVARIRPCAALNL